jgi:uncharacterized membrane protein
MARTQTILASIIVASFALGIYFYPQLPSEVASHWDINGQVNGYMPKFWGVFFVPLLTVALLALFTVIPKIDPMKENIKKFRGYFDNFLIIIVLFLFYTHVLTILWNIGITFDLLQLIIPPIGILLYYAGVMMENSKRNWSIGIRTPWTISDDRVWDKTNRLGGKVFKASGAIAMFGALMPMYAIYLMIFPVMLGSAYTVAYSYFEYMRLNRGNMRRK